MRSHFQLGFNNRCLCCNSSIDCYWLCFDYDSQEIRRPDVLLFNLLYLAFDTDIATISYPIYRFSAPFVIFHVQTEFYLFCCKVVMPFECNGVLSHLKTDMGNSHYCLLSLWGTKALQKKVVRFSWHKKDCKLGRKCKLGKA